MSNAFAQKLKSYPDMKNSVHAVDFKLTTRVVAMVQRYDILLGKIFGLCIGSAKAKT
jgi:pterin-4a-carbinolamine dehydratase